MIVFENVSKKYIAGSKRKPLLTEFSHIFKGGINTAIMGPNQQDRTAFLELCNGVMAPDAGSIVRTSTVSFPIGFRNYFNAELSMIQNLRFISLIYMRNFSQLVDYVCDFCGIEESMLHVRGANLDTNLVGLIFFAVSLDLHFDFTIVDRVISTGTVEMAEKCRLGFQSRKKNSTLIMSSDSNSVLTEYCDQAILLSRGKATFYSDIEEAIGILKEL